MTCDNRVERPLEVLNRHDGLAIAVSGGVDSMVLCYVAHALARTSAMALHAVSPAVPAIATARVEAYAHRHGWHLQRIDAGELSDPNYRANPVNRCFFCKSNLYARIRAETTLPIASGTNRDDLDDYRPGLDAAGRHGVVHPYVEAGLTKADIYGIAAAYGLDDLARLPAQPCLASRIETGIGVDAASLQFIEQVETALGGMLPPGGALRCRITRAGVFIECAPLPAEPERERVETEAARLCSRAGRAFAGLRPYRRGSAFLTASVA